MDSPKTRFPNRAPTGPQHLGDGLAFTVSERIGLETLGNLCLPSSQGTPEPFGTLDRVSLDEVLTMSSLVNGTDSAKWGRNDSVLRLLECAIPFLRKDQKGIRFGETLFLITSSTRSVSKRRHRFPDVQAYRIRRSVFRDRLRAGSL